MNITNTNLFTNLKSGFFISLIALPLCLGISIACSCPPMAGIITAIVGGLIGIFYGGCKLSIKGPAAGLIVIVLAAVTELGAGDPLLGYKRMLAVAAVAAIIQILFAIFRFSRFGSFLPPSVIHGMLAAIGIIILAKQIHVLLGAHPHGKTPIDLISEIPASILNVNPELAFIGIFTLLLMMILPFIPVRLIKGLPPALFALFVVIPLSLYWHLDFGHNYSFLNHNFSVGPEYLVNIPKDILNSIIFPDFSILKNALAYKYVVMLALVGSIESVLTVIAVDEITREKSKLDRDLLGVGIGNFLAAMIGGLPMISEVIRSKANVDSGARDHWSNFFHGAFLLVFISVLAPLIREIPLAALAAMLMITGYRLASPKQFLHMRAMGFDQLLLFTTTLIMTIATDLLVGIICGCTLKILIHISRGVKIKQFFSISINYKENKNSAHLTIEGPAIFTNCAFLQDKIVSAVARNEKIIVDVSSASLIDHTTLNCFKNLKNEFENKIDIVGLGKLLPLSHHELSTHRLA